MSALLTYTHFSKLFALLIFLLAGFDCIVSFMLRDTVLIHVHSRVGTVNYTGYIVEINM